LIWKGKIKLIVNQLKVKMERGEKVVGTLTHLGGSTTIECLGLAGLDFVVIDTEHAPFTTQDTMDYIRAAELRGITPVVRVQDYSRPSLHKMLNSGAKALIIPCMETVEEVKALVSEGKYYPKGKHNFPYARNSSWGVESATRLRGFLDENNENTLIIPQCETQGFLDNIEEIVRIDGVDGVFVGPWDLTTGMGIPEEFTNPLYLNARKRIIKACHDAGKFAWIFSPSGAVAKQNLKDGFDGTAVLIDTVVYINAFKQLYMEVKDFKGE